MPKAFREYFPGQQLLPRVLNRFPGAAVLARHPQLMLMTDDVYEHIRFDAEAPPHILQAAPSLADRTLVVNGVSKTYAMTGWRIGCAAGPYDIIKAMGIVQSQSTSGVC